MDVISEKIRGVEIKLRTRPGVFSKGKVDQGSKLLLEKVDIEDGTLIADMGCGSGVIGLVVTKLNPRGHVHLLDVNLRVVDLVKENVELNDLRNAEVYLSDNFSAVSGRTYNQILSNPAQHLGNQFLEELAKECRVHLKPGGRVTWVVQKHIGPFVERLFQSVFKNVKIVAHGSEYVVMRASKNV